jgi:hypothetical protein
MARVLRLQQLSAAMADLIVLQVLHLVVTQQTARLARMVAAVAVVQAGTQTALRLGLEVQEAQGRISQ